MLAQFLQRYRLNLQIVAIASVLLNVLTFAGSLYMLLVYDSVLPSRSLPTLFGLFVILIVVYAFQAVFEAIRGRSMLLFANAVRGDMFGAVHKATVRRSLRLPGGSNALQPVRDLDQVHAYLTGPGPTALIDLPWVVVFLLVLTILHWTLGLAALVGALVLAAVAWVSERRTREANQLLTEASGRRSGATAAELRFAEAAQAMGMADRLLARSARLEVDYVAVQSRLSQTVARFGGFGRVFRIFLQSVILTVGAMLVIDGQASGGVIIASSILAGRALAPIDQAIATWRGLAAARSGWERLTELLGSADAQAEAPSVALDPPHGEIAVRDIWVTPPGSQNVVLGGVSLTLSPGQVLAVVGPSASGKTSLARALLGVWPIARGEIRLGGATHAQWAPEMLGQHFGYVPQSVELVEGTIAENIARLDPEATSDSVMTAAKAAGMHEAILALPDGYDSRVSVGGAELSAGQRQRIGLARALYGAPFLLVLDEANSNLDAAGDEALAAAIAGVKARNGIVVMITHRPATLGPATHIAVLRAGRIAEYGERDEVVAKLQQGEARQVTVKAKAQ